MNSNVNNISGKTAALDTRGPWSHIAIINAVIIAAVVFAMVIFAISTANPPVL